VRDAIVDGLFAPYLVEGRDVSEAGVLAGEEVAAEERAARRLGVEAVPTFLLDGRPLVAGAQEPGLLAAGRRDAARAHG
jgi:hypothetical protein